MSIRRVFLKQLGLNTAGFLLLPGLASAAPGLTAASSDPAAVTTPGLTAAAPGSGPLPRSTPEQQGISSAAIRGFLAAIAASGQEFHSIMIIRHGHVVAEGWWSPFAAQQHQQLYSLSKSFTGTAIGMATDEKLLKPDDPVISFFPKDQPSSISSNLAALKVRHLLSMSVGQEKDSILTLEHTPEGTTWEETFLALPIVYEPGTRFLYNSGASYMLSSIVRQVTGHSVHEYLKPRLYDPLGITGATWTENAEGVNMGASNLRIRTEDIGKLGQLYLQQGRWNGRQLISREWVALATKKEIDTGKNDSSWGYGYGYQFWMNPPGGFRADGAYGQYSMVFPAKDTVVVITSESADKETTMHTVWDHIYPALTDHRPLPPNTVEYHRLQQELTALVLPPPIFNAQFPDPQSPVLNPPSSNLQSPLSANWSGKTFLLDKNQFNAKAVSFRFDNDRTIFTLSEEGKPDIIITCGINKWILKGNRKPFAHSLFSLRRIDFDSPVAASAGWKDEHTLVLTFRFVEAIHGDTLTCLFDQDRLRIRFMFSGARMDKRPDDRPDLTATMQAWLAVNRSKH
ncbi:MAG TPA: serine hydrolase [Puia sp.]|jgi:CubicO group peptidase (beta-lactamase class C family)|nr:serine hydrolase [Puia sp.]